MKLLVVYFAAFGFLVSAVAHIAAIRGVILGGEGMMFAYFGGMFLAFFPTVFLMSRRFPRSGPKFTWSEALKHCPAPIRVLFYATFFYAIGSFLFLWGQGTKMKHHSGEPLSAETARGFSGHAMAFYMTSIAVMLSLHREEKNA